MMMMGGGGCNDSDNLMFVKVHVMFVKYNNLSNYCRVRDRQYGDIRVLESHNQITQGQWHHIAVTYDYENSKQAIYCNGTVRFLFL